MRLAPRILPRTQSAKPRGNAGFYKHGRDDNPEHAVPPSADARLPALHLAFLGLFDTRGTSNVPWMAYFRGVMPCLSRRLGLHFWRHLAAGGLRVLQVTGSHHSFLGKEHADGFVPTFTRAWVLRLVIHVRPSGRAD